MMHALPTHSCWDGCGSCGASPSPRPRLQLFCLALLKKQRERRKANPKQYMIEGGRLKPPLSAKEVAAAALLMVGSLAVSMAAQAPTSLATKRLCFAHGLHLWSRPPSSTWHGSPAHSSIARNAIFTRGLSAVQTIAPSIGKVLGERARNAMLRMSADKAGIDEEVSVSEPRTQDVAKKAADIDVEDEEWKKWKTKFSGKFVLKSKTATGTSIRAAREDSAVTAEAAEVLLLEKGRVLSFDEELMYGGGMNDIYQIDDDDEEEEDDGSVGDDIPGAEKMTVVHLDKGRLKIKVRGPSDKIEAFDMACEEVGGGAADYIPYWVEMWPSAVALAEHMASNMEIRNKRVLEISAGIGLPGLTACVAGAKRVQLTEFDPAAIRVIEASGESLKRQGDAAGSPMCDVETSIFDWFKPTGTDIMTEVDAWDVVALADVMYESRFVKPVSWVVAQLLKINQGCTAVITDPQRDSLPTFIDELKKQGLTVDAQKTAIQTLVADVGGELQKEPHVITILTITSA